MKPMKNYLTTLLTFLLFWHTTSELYAAPPDNFVYSTYVVGSKIKSDVNTAQQNMSEFDCIYLVAPPKWIADDFDKSQDFVNKKYVQEYKHANECYIHKYVRNVHKSGNKILCSFPGREFIDIASFPQRRVRFAKMMAQYVRKYNYDGIELDWEQTFEIDKHNAFMAEIRKALDELNSQEHLLLTTALHSHHKYTQEQAAQLVKSADWINLMCYDMGGGCWNSTLAKHNAPLDVISKQVAWWTFFPKEKLCIGLASYGFYYKDLMPETKTKEGLTLEDHGRYCSYTELPKLIEKGWYERWDETAQCSYYISPDNNDFMTLESSRSIKAKMDWVYEEGFRGVFWWEFHCDWIPSTDKSRGKHLIMDEVTRVVKPNCFN